METVGRGRRREEEWEEVPPCVWDRVLEIKREEQEAKEKEDKEEEDEDEKEEHEDECHLCGRGRGLEVEWGD